MPSKAKSTVFAFDLDGTIYAGNSLIQGADEVVHFLRRQGTKVIFFTNSSTRTVNQVHEKLTRMGLEPELNDIHTSARAAAFYTSQISMAQVYCIGTDGLKSELHTYGIKVLDSAEFADTIVIGLDPEFTYAKLAAVMTCRNPKCRLIACNRDKSYPIENNVHLPGCGPIVAAVEDVFGKRVDFIAGKPNTYMLDLLTHQLGCKNTDITVIGDSYESDIQMAVRYGARSFLISTCHDKKLDGTTQVADIRDVLSFVG